MNAKSTDTHKDRSALRRERALKANDKPDNMAQEPRFAEPSAVKQASAWARKQYSETFKKLAE